MDAMHELLHSLAIKKHAEPEALASLSGIPVTELRSLMERALATGRAVETQAKFMLTPAAHMILESQYGSYCAAAREDAAIVAAYERFEVVNSSLKQTITDWQTMNVGGQKLPNDHSDLEYDERVIDAIGTLHERCEPLLKIFAGYSSRFSRYAKKLTEALEKAEDGAREWVSEVNIDSYHTVWFEMHEDLLRVLGRERDE